MDNRPTFVLLTAKTCPGCHGFKRNVWSELKSELEERKRVKIVEVDVETTGTKPDPEKYHPQLRQFIGWFPTVALFPSERWNDHQSELIGIIKNGKLVPPTEGPGGQMIPEHVEQVGTMDLSKDGILTWVDRVIDNDKMFNKPNNNKNGENGINNRNENGRNGENGINNRNENGINNRNENGINNRNENGRNGNGDENNKNRILSNGNLVVPTVGNIRFKPGKIKRYDNF